MLLLAPFGRSAAMNSHAVHEIYARPDLEWARLCEKLSR